ncbi:hypothetical protein HCH_02636 [Hahella chejuensis KCTC 2396]|uniref:Uncharacterized protein n=1 Tax=Hahella chejuensis (strain KCTC 2396) TaxID=349521 RepID=Q2SIU8_HAHCH|nr:hypothetical protein HCH_02636 [Hahella chejuensis KCTC 2396]
MPFSLILGSVLRAICRGIDKKYFHRHYLLNSSYFPGFFLTSSLAFFSALFNSIMSAAVK